MFSLAGKVALITGAASGIGRATAARFAEAGATVQCVDLVADTLDPVVAEIGNGATSRACNVTDSGQVAATVAETLAIHERIDVLCNVAGVLHFEETHKVTDEEWHRVIDVNLHGTFYMARAVLGPMVEQGSGVILNTASSAAYRAQAWAAAYAASKGAIVSLTQTLAIEYGRQGIRCNAVAPAAVRTPIMDDFRFLPDVDLSLVERCMPFDGELAPVDVANAFLYLASEEADRINGITMKVDDGMMA